MSLFWNVALEVWKHTELLLLYIYRQQDAQEFLRYVLEGLHEDVNRVITKQKHSVPDEEEEDRLRWGTN